MITQRKRKKKIFCFFFVFWLCHTACGILFLWPGIELVPPTLEVWSLNHWTAREVPKNDFFFFFYFGVVLSHKCNGTSSWGRWLALVFLLYECCAKLLQFCPTLCNPMAVACQAPLSMRFSRQEYWSGLPFPSPGEHVFLIGPFAI